MFLVFVLVFVFVFVFVSVRLRLCLCLCAFSLKTKARSYLSNNCSNWLLLVQETKEHNALVLYLKHCEEIEGEYLIRVAGFGYYSSHWYYVPIR